MTGAHLVEGGPVQVAVLVPYTQITNVDIVQGPLMHISDLRVQTARRLPRHQRTLCSWSCGRSAGCLKG